MNEILYFEDKIIEDIERNLKIIEAIWNGTIQFSNEGEGDIVCEIGQNWFYFWAGKEFADMITAKNIHEHVTIFELNQMIRAAIEELDDDESHYYTLILKW